MFVVSKSAKHLSKELKGMQLLCEYPLGSSPLGQSSPHPLRAYYDAPAQPRLSVSQHPAATALIIKGRLGAKPIRALIDTGATHSFATHAATSGTALSASTLGSVEVANGRHERLSGTAVLPLQLQKYMGNVTLHVLPQLPHNVDIILGMDWLSANGAVLNIPHGRCTLTKVTHGTRTKHYDLVADGHRHRSGEVS